MRSWSCTRPGEHDRARHVNRSPQLTARQPLVAIENVKLRREAFATRDLRLCNVHSIVRRE